MSIKGVSIVKKGLKRVSCILIGVVCLFLAYIPSQAWKQTSTFSSGLYIDDINLDGLSEEDAMKKVQAYVDEKLAAEITLTFSDDKSITLTAAELGVEWSNPDVLKTIICYGQRGNIVTRFKQIQDLKRNRVDFNIEFRVDEETVNNILETQVTPFDENKEEPSLTRENDIFSIVEGREGKNLNLDQSVQYLQQYFSEDWTKESVTLQLVVDIEEPIWNEEALLQITDILGTYTTSFKTSGTERSNNIVNAASKVNGQTVYPGEEFSTMSYMVPFTEKNGYQEAHSYSGGRVVESVGGGICQVSSTLYNAVLLSELEVTCRKNHALIVTYVPLSADATISEDSGIDFTWVNNTDYPIYVECLTTSNKSVICTIYGKDTRPENRTITFESETLSETIPEGEIIYVDNTKPAGYIDVQSAHYGYKARLWKIECVDGLETSREIVSESTYKSAKRSATIGTVTDDPLISAAITEILAYGSVDYAKEVVARINSGYYTTQQVTNPEAVIPDSPVEGTDNQP